MSPVRRLQIPQYTSGVPLTIETGRNLTDAQELVLLIRRPDGAVLERTLDASAITNTARGTITYTIQPADFAVNGPGELQVYDTTGGQRLPNFVTAVDVTPSIPLGR